MLISELKNLIYSLVSRTIVCFRGHSEKQTLLFSWLAKKSVNRDSTVIRLQGTRTPKYIGKSPGYVAFKKPEKSKNK